MLNMALFAVEAIMRLRQHVCWFRCYIGNVNSILYARITIIRTETLPLSNIISFSASTLDDDLAVRYCRDNHLVVGQKTQEI